MIPESLAKGKDGGNGGISMTFHAFVRAGARRLSHDAIEAALIYGNVVHTRGAVIYAIGKKELQRSARQGVDLSRYEGIQVVCHPKGQILMVYKNRSLRGLQAR